MKNYDIVQLINPIFFEVKAERLFYFYKFLKKHNKQVFLGAYGMDWYWVHTCTFEKPLRYSDFNIGNNVRTNADAVREQKDWLNTPKEKLNKYIANDCDGIITGLYEYHACYSTKFPNKTTFIPYPIKPQEPLPLKSNDRIKIFIGISKGRNEYKGTDIMLKAAEDIINKYPDKAELLKVEGVPYEKYKELMNGSDAILDQLYSYTPSMNPLLAMSKGIICIGGGEPENYEIINEKELRPIINVQPTYESVYHELEKLILTPSIIPELKKQSIEYICKHHHYIKVAKEYEKVYMKKGRN